jgi:Sec-independent protein secretion pathway component TatC
VYIPWVLSPSRLIFSTAAILVAFAVCFYFARDIYTLLVWPYRLAAGVDTPIEMIYTAPQEFFFTRAVRRRLHRLPGTTGL